MAATTLVEKAEEYDVALAGFLATYKYVKTKDAALAAQNAEFLAALIVLTPEMSQGGEEKVMYDIETLFRLQNQALRAQAVSHVHHFEDRRMPL